MLMSSYLPYYSSWKMRHKNGSLRITENKFFFFYVSPKLSHFDNFFNLYPKELLIMPGDI